MDSIKLSDVADALNLSVTTVSRALSGKGRVAESTVEKVRAYISEHSYIPNRSAQALVFRRTFSIGILVPMDALVSEVWFFHKALMGAVRTASSMGYDTIVSVHDGGDSLKKLIASRKAEGYIFLRAIEDDPNVSMLSERNIPFAVIGNCRDKNALCVDCRNEEHASELTERLVGMGAGKLLLLLGDMSHTVNMERRRGVEKAAGNVSVVTGVQTAEDVDRALENAGEYDAVIAGDDLLCLKVDSSSNRRNVKLLSSLYPSPLIKGMDGVVAAEGNDPSLLGAESARLLIENLNNREIIAGEK